MKKNKLYLILAIVFFMVIALGSGSSSSDDSKNTNISTDTSNETKIDVTLEETVIFDQNDVKITAKEIVTDSIWGQGIKILIENNSSSDVAVGCDALAVNGYMVSDLMYETVTAGQKSNATINCLSSELEKAGITNIGEVDVWFYLSDDSYHRIYESEQPSVIKTSAYDSIDSSLEIEGKEILNQDGVRIVAQYVDEDSFWGKSVLIYAENNSGHNISLTCNDESINGFMIDGYYYANIKDGYKAFDTIEFFDSTLEENDIDKIENIKMKFTCLDTDSYQRLFESDYVEIYAE